MPRFYKVEVNKTEWEIPERYNQLQPVGSGSYGQVCSAVDTKYSDTLTQATDTRVAIKKLPRPFHSVVHAKRTYRELRMLKHMCHENVIGLLDVFHGAKSLEEFNQLYLVMHLLGADLNNIVRTQRLTDEHVQFLVYQILRGLKYIHSAGIIHRDLKPSNIAVNADCELKIIDFGLARPTENEMTGYVATRWYRAPEIMLNWMHYNQTVDIWSVGCIMAELLTGRTLFPGNDHIHQLNLIMEVLGTPSAEFMQRISSESWLVPAEDPKMNDKGTHVIRNLLNSDQKNLGSRNLRRIGEKRWENINIPENKNKAVNKMVDFSSETLQQLLKVLARMYIQSLPVLKKRSFTDVFKGANPLAIDLLEKMLELDPGKRVTAEQALAHPYLAQYADPSDEPCSQPYDESFEHMDLTVDKWKELVYEEVANFKPVCFPVPRESA